MLQCGLAPSPLIATHLAMLWHHIRHVIAWMSGPKCDKAHFLHSLSGRLKGELGHLQGSSKGESGELLVEAKGIRSFGLKHPKTNLSRGDWFLAFKKKKKDIWREEMGFIYHLLLFSCFSSFSMVVFLPSIK